MQHSAAEAEAPPLCTGERGGRASWSTHSPGFGTTGHAFGGGDGHRLSRAGWPSWLCYCSSFKNRTRVYIPDQLTPIHSLLLCSLSYPLPPPLHFPSVLEFRPEHSVTASGGKWNVGPPSSPPLPPLPVCSSLSRDWQCETSLPVAHLQRLAPEFSLVAGYNGH